MPAGAAGGPVGEVYPPDALTDEYALSFGSNRAPATRR